MTYILANVPAPLSSLASRESILSQNAELRYLLDRCCTQMQKDHALKKLMDKENGRLRKRLYDKTNKHAKKVSSGFARHMTSEESLDALAREEWASEMKEVFKDRVWKARRDAYEKYVREMAAEQKRQGKRRESGKRLKKNRKGAEKDEERQRKEIQRFREKEERQRRAEREKALKAAAKLQKVAEAAAKRAAKEASVRPRQNTHKQNKDQEVPNPTVESNVDGNEGPVLARQRPRPR